MRAQQGRFDAFIRSFNHERPHGALGDETPASIWTPSPRPFPRGPLRPDYPGHCEVRRVSRAGTFRLFSTQVFLSHALADDYIALEEVDDGLWDIVFYKSLLDGVRSNVARAVGAALRPPSEEIPEVGASSGSRREQHQRHRAKKKPKAGASSTEV